MAMFTVDLASSTWLDSIGDFSSPVREEPSPPDLSRCRHLQPSSVNPMSGLPQKAAQAHSPMVRRPSLFWSITAQHDMGISRDSSPEDTPMRVFLLSVSSQPLSCVPHTAPRLLHPVEP